MSERLLKPRQAADKLGVSVATIYDWAAARRIPCVRLFGSALRFKESDLERIIRQHECPAIRQVPERASA